MSVWLQVTSARGPAECCWVVERLVAQLRKEAASAGLKPEVIELTPNEGGPGLRSALVALSGEGAAHFAKSYRGTVQWIGQSPFRPNHRRKNFFVGVDVFEEPKNDAIDLKGVRIEFCRSGGPGGQHVNKTETAVRVTHEPSGISIRIGTERSQHRNRQLAMAMLAARLQAATQEKANEGRQARWSQHNALERGNATRVYAGAGFERVG